MVYLEDINETFLMEIREPGCKKKASCFGPRIGMCEQSSKARGIGSRDGLIAPCSSISLLLPLWGHLEDKYGTGSFKRSIFSSAFQNKS